MPGYTKRQLKEDRFKTSAAEAMHWTEEHRRTLIIGVIALVAVVAIAVGGWAYIQHQNDKASVEVGQALRTLNAKEAMQRVQQAISAPLPRQRASAALAEGLWQYQFEWVIPWRKVVEDYLTFDTTVVVRYGQQEGARKGPNPRRYRSTSQTTARRSSRAASTTLPPTPSSPSWTS